MAVRIKLTEDERDEILATLSQEQRSFIDQQLNSRRRTAFMLELAKRQGRYITDAMSDAEIEQIVEDWTFVETRDAGRDWQKTKKLHCQCGRVLRYQYTMRNNTTGDVLRLGIDHLEQEAHIDAATVKAIVRGLELVNVDTDERLANVAQGLRFEDQVREVLPDDFELPAPVDDVVTLGLPLIRREIEQVRKGLDEYRWRESEKRREQTQGLRRENMLSGAGLAPSRSTRIFDDDDDDISNAGSKVNLSASAVSEIDRLMNTRMQSVAAMGEVLARQGYVSRERYATGKLRIYPHICIYLEQARDEGRVVLLTAAMDDRTYRLNVQGE